MTQVTAYCADLDPEDAPILVAIGRAVWGIAAFEKALQGRVRPDLAVSAMPTRRA